MPGELNLRRLFKRPIVIYQALVDLAGDLNAGAMLSQAFYWLERVEDDRDGWFYKTQVDWESETRLTRSQQERARSILRKFDFWEEKFKGLPRKLWFRIDEAKLQAALIALDAAPNNAGNLHYVSEETSRQGGGKPASINRKHEITTESTSENTFPLASPATPAEAEAKTPKKKTSIKENKPNRAKDELVEIFQDRYMQFYGAPYGAKRGDFVRLAELRKIAEGNDWPLTLDRWVQAMGNYFASDLGARTLADFCARFSDYYKKQYDRYGKEKGNGNGKTQPKFESGADRKERNAAAILKAYWGIDDAGGCSEGASGPTEGDCAIDIESARLLQSGLA